ncbi:hypothetical protein CXB51_019061 [Gossypium anomalum]|uniref:Reverse transcriptase Ty1/copia-type domain-containing protein n=1 Tax=Gossypium anomalum TaxID=47600 RepID=A0A8J6CW01_9ROSI|nr:hypothetical protein CXB51_019061 [Gossypium anomalum]
MLWKKSLHPWAKIVKCYLLGIRVKLGKDGILISQRKYVVDLWKKFNMFSCKVVGTPMNVNEKLQLEDGTEKADDTSKYSFLSWSHFKIHAQPPRSISLEQPIESRVILLELQLLGCGTHIILISFYVVLLILIGQEPWIIEKVSENFFILGSAAISWSYKKQPTVAMSSSKAKYVAAACSACQTLWLRKLLADLHQEQKGATAIFRDNLSATAMTKIQFPMEGQSS